MKPINYLGFFLLWVMIFTVLIFNGLNLLRLLNVDVEIMRLKECFYYSLLYAASATLGRYFGS